MKEVVDRALLSQHVEQPLTLSRLNLVGMQEENARPSWPMVAWCSHGLWAQSSERCLNRWHGTLRRCSKCRTRRIGWLLFKAMAEHAVNPTAIDTTVPQNIYTSYLDYFAGIRGGAIAVPLARNLPGPPTLGCVLHPMVTLRESLQTASPRAPFQEEIMPCSMERLGPSTPCGLLGHPPTRD